MPENGGTLRLDGKLERRYRGLYALLGHRRAGGSGLTRRIGSLDALVLVSSAAALIVLLPLRSASEAFPPVPFAATLVLFVAPGVLLAHWLLEGAVSGPALVAVGFAISAGVFGLLGVPVLVAHGSIEAYLWAAGAVLAASLFAAAWRVLRARKTAAHESGGVQPIFCALPPTP